MEVGSLSRIDEMFEELPPVLSVKDLTHILGKDRATVYRWLKKGEIPGVLIESTWVIYRDEVKDYLLSRHNQAGAIPPESALATNGKGELRGQ
jgi:excisionase family DNA binding protein